MCNATGLPSLADDTGLEVDALNGAPGVRTARFAGEQATDADMQRGFLTLLSGRRHHVLSAVAVIDGDGRLRSRICDSIVRFKRLSPEEIESYIESGEGLGKAGGYAIQGRAEALIDWMAGSHSGVIGLPLYETRSLLRASGYPLA